MTIWLISLRHTYINCLNEFCAQLSDIFVCLPLPLILCRPFCITKLWQHLRTTTAGMDGNILGEREYKRAHCLCIWLFFCICFVFRFNSALSTASASVYVQALACERCSRFYFSRHVDIVAAAGFQFLAYCRVLLMTRGVVLPPAAPPRPRCVSISLIHYLCIYVFLSPAIV